MRKTENNVSHLLYQFTFNAPLVIEMGAFRSKELQYLQWTCCSYTYTSLRSVQILLYSSPTTSKASVESRASVKSRAAMSSGQITKRISSCTQPLPSTPPPTILVKRKDRHRSKHVLWIQLTHDQTTYCMANIPISKVNLKQTCTIIFYGALTRDM